LGAKESERKSEEEEASKDHDFCNLSLLRLQPPTLPKRFAQQILDLPVQTAERRIRPLLGQIECFRIDGQQE